MAEHRDEQEALHRAIMRLNERAWGIAFGLIAGIGLFVATNVLVVKGGESVGQHLALLAIYFPGYRVTFLGSVVGFIYAFVLGYILGRLIGVIYNRVAGASA